MKLEKYIKTKKIKKLRVADDLEITRQHLHKIITGKCYPGRDLIVRIEKWSSGKVTARDLLGLRS